MRGVRISVMRGDNECNAGGDRLAAFVDARHTFPHMLNAEGELRVRQVMNMLHTLRPELTYSPMLFGLGVAFTHLLEPPQTLSMMFALLTSAHHSPLAQLATHKPLATQGAQTQGHTGGNGAGATFASPKKQKPLAEWVIVTQRSYQLSVLIFQALLKKYSVRYIYCILFLPGSTFSFRCANLKLCPFRILAKINTG